MSVKPRVNLILDSLILVTFILTILSGFRLDVILDSVSLQTAQAAEPILHLSNVHPAAHFHIGMSAAFLILVVIHQFVHWKWIMSQIRQLMRTSGQPSRVPER